MKYCFLVLCITAVCSCSDISKNKAANDKTLISKYSTDTSIHFIFGRNVAWGYSFAIPLNFVEQIDTIGQVDSFVLYSPDKKSKLIYFSEEQVGKRDSVVALLQKYSYSSIAKWLANDNYKITGSWFFTDKESSNSMSYFIAIGRSSEKEWIWKTQLSEIPISGSLAYTTMLLTYPAISKKYYEPLGLKLANELH